MAQSETFLGIKVFFPFFVAAPFQYKKEILLRLITNVHQRMEAMS